MLLWTMGIRRAHWLPRLWARLLLTGAGLVVRSSGQENLAPGETYVFACNHRSALDIPVLLAVLPPNFRWIAKKELFHLPVFGSWLRMLGYIAIDRSNRQAAMASLRQAAERIREGASVVIFPEGTRSQGRGLLPFKKGGFRLALKARRPVVPVAIVGSGEALPPRHYLLAPGRLRVKMGTPLAVARYQESQANELAQDVRGRVEALLAANS